MSHCERRRCEFGDELCYLTFRDLVGRGQERFGGIQELVSLCELLQIPLAFGCQHVVSIMGLETHPPFLLEIPGEQCGLL